MRGILILALFGCDAVRSNNNNDQGMLQFGDEDMAVAGDLAGAPLPDLTSAAVDLAGVDLAGVDLRALPDLAVAVDFSGVDLLGTITPGDTCGTAPSLVPNLVYDDQDTTNLANDYQIGALAAGGCNMSANVYKEHDAAYTISVPNGKTLTVTVTPENIPTVWDPALAIVEDCNNGATCLAGHDDSNLTGQDEVVSWTNASGAAKNVFVIVDAYGHTTNGSNFGYGRYRIQATVQ
jgi:hypothetical protein